MRARRIARHLLMVVFVVALIVPQSIWAGTNELTSSERVIHSVSIDVPDCRYDGTAQEPEIKIAGLTEDVDFTVSYSNNINIGRATATITGIGEWSGEITKSFHITFYFETQGSITRDVNYETLYFGSYPQTEIVKSKDMAGWSAAGSYIVDDELYTTLQEANWDSDGDVTVDGTKYRRLERPHGYWIDEGSENSTGYFNWGDESERYFRYEPIKWRVLDKTGDEAFLLSDLTLDMQEYTEFHYSDRDTSSFWELSTLRAWLNGNFYDRAFTPMEKDYIFTTDVVNAGNIESGASGGDDTQDKVFLLSEDDVYGSCASYYGFSASWSNEDKVRISKSSSFAKAMGLLNNSNNCEWWLRSPGQYEEDVTSVSDCGTVDIYGSAVGNDMGVRPALRLNLKSNDLVSKSDNLLISPQREFWVAEIVNDIVPYRNKPCEPEVAVWGLTEGRDYTLNYSNNDKPGVAVISITGIGKFSGTITRDFAIVDGIDISGMEADLSKENWTYSGQPCEPKVEIYGLIEGEDYEISYINNDRLGKAKAIITGINGYVGTIEKTFNITKEDITIREAKLEETTCIYSGQPCEPKVIIEGLTEGNHYMVKYSNNDRKGTAKAIITGINGYVGTIEKSFEIIEDISIKDVNLAETSCIYSGQPCEPKVTIDGLTEGEDFTVEYIDNSWKGTAKAVITGINGCTGTVEKSFKVKLDITNMEVNLAETTCIYSGTACRPKLTIDGLTEGVDFKARYFNNRAAGTATALAEGINDCVGAAEKNFEIKEDISIREAILSETSCMYSGQPCEPEVTIEGLTKDKDYEVSYANNNSPGIATMTITGINSYVGTIEKTFEVKCSISDKEVILSDTSYIHNGAEIRPEVVIEGLREGTDYTVSYSNNVDVGTATVTITGIGFYTDSVEKTFEIKHDILCHVAKAPTYRFVGYDAYETCKVPGCSYVSNYNELPKKIVATTSIKSMTRASKAFTVKWSKKAYTGYQIQYSLKSNMTSSKTVTVTKASITSKKITKLKARKTYYVRVRCYKTELGKKVYSKWSTKKTVRTK